MDNDEKPFRKAIQKAIASSPERQKLEAHLEALEQEQQRRRAARGEPEPVIIDTGVPRQPCEEGCRCWRHSPAEPYDAAAEREKDRLAAKQLESPNAPPRRKPPPPEPAPPPPSREWRYCYVQVRGPRDGDCGMILDGMYAVSGGLLWLEDTGGNPIGRTKLEPGDDPASVARRLLRAKHQVKSSVAGFYDRDVSGPRTYH